MLVVIEIPFLVGSLCPVSFSGGIEETPLADGAKPPQTANLAKFAN